MAIFATKLYHRHLRCRADGQCVRAKSDITLRRMQRRTTTHLDTDQRTRRGLLISCAYSTLFEKACDRGYGDGSSSRRLAQNLGNFSDDAPKPMTVKLQKRL